MVGGLPFHPWRPLVNASKNQRVSERIPVSQRVKVLYKGRMMAYAMSINIGSGGVLLASGAILPVGSSCNLAILLPEREGLKRITAEGLVVRSDATGTAVRFLSALEGENLETLSKRSLAPIHQSILDAYKAYFSVSKNKDLADCEKLLGVSKQTFRTSFYISFFSCISLSILPVWLFRGAISIAPNWAIIALSFGYGAFWLAVIQPSVDLAVFHFLRQKQSTQSNA